MIKQLQYCAIICLLLLPTANVAAKKKPVQPTAPESVSFKDISQPSRGSFFIGLGGSYDSIKLDQNLNLNGTSTLTGPFILSAASSAGGGAATPFHNTQSLFAPEAQIGYFKHFNDSTRLWGVKLLYRYLGATASNQHIDSFPTGAFTNTDPLLGTIITENLFAKSAQTNINHELALLAFIGESFTNSQIYMGIGPVLVNTETKLYDAIGFAGIDGFRLDTIDSAASFTNSQWLLGGAIQLGFVYFLSPTWFIDCNYTYAMTGRHTNNDSAAFSSASPGLFTNAGTLQASSSERITAQAAAISINKTFDL